MNQPKEKRQTQPQTVSELILEARRQTGASYRELAMRARRAGYPIKFQYLNELANVGPKSWPKYPDTFRGLAAILQVPVRTVVLAFATSLGLDVDRPRSKLAEQLPETHLSDDMTHALLQVIRAAGGNEQSATKPPLSGETPE